MNENGEPLAALGPTTPSEPDEGESLFLSTSSSAWASTSVGPSDFKNVLEAIQKHKQEATFGKRVSQNVLAMTFTGAELVEQLVSVAKVPGREDAVSTAQSLLDNGVIELVDNAKARDTLTPVQRGATDLLHKAPFAEASTYTPVLLHELSDKLIGKLLGLLRLNGRGKVCDGAFMFKESDAQECWTKGAAVAVPTRQDASDICQEMVNKGFIEPVVSNFGLTKTLRRSEVRGAYVVRGEPYLCWGPLVCPGWKVRWFLCKSAEDRMLYCYKSPRQGRPKALLDLSEAYFNDTCTEGSNCGNNCGFGDNTLDFAIETPSKVWKFQALTPEAFVQWRRVVEQSSAYIYATNNAIDVLSGEIAESANTVTQRFLASPATTQIKIALNADGHGPHSTTATNVASFIRVPSPSEFAVYAPLGSIDYSASEKLCAEEDLPCVLQCTASDDHVTAITLVGDRLWAGTMGGAIYAAALSRTPQVVSAKEQAAPPGGLTLAGRGTHKGRVTTLAATRTRVWSGDAVGCIAVWDTATGGLVTAFTHRNGKPAIAAADRLRELIYLAGAHPGTVEVWYAAGTPGTVGARLVVTLPECKGDVTRVKVSEDCRTWWAAGATQDRALYEVDAEKQAVVRRLCVPGSLSAVVSIAPCEGSCRGLWSSHAGGELCFWDPSGARRVYARRSACRGAGWAAENLWAKRGCAVVLGKGGDVVMWDAANVSVQRGIVPVTKIHTGRGCIHTLGCDAMSQYIAVVNEVGEIIVYDVFSRLRDTNTQ